MSAFELWGIDKALEKFEGMFAIALFDKKENLLYLIRDRIGEKPLFYGFQKGLFFFSSEVRSFSSIPFFSKDISYEAVNTFLHHGYFFDDQTIYKNVKNLNAGAYLKINVSGLPESLDNIAQIKRYWVLKKSTIKNQYANINDATDDLDSLLKRTIQDQMISDVPLGAFLSGGIDSSLVVAIMNEVSSNKIKTFSIGFENKFFDESNYAAKIANYIGTDHNQLIINEKEILDLSISMIDSYDQPFGDVSSIPTRLVSDFAKSQVTVSLSGDAGDELFCGYDRYSIFDKYYNFPFRKPLGALIHYLPKNLIGDFFSKFPVDAFNYINARRINKLGNMLKTNRNSKYSYQSLLMHVTDMHELNIFRKEKNNYLIKYYNDLNKIIDIDENTNHLEYAMWNDLKSYLPNDILVKVDRAAMSVSLETRVPFLNHKIVEFARKLPLKYKYNRQQGKKIILKNLLSKKIPNHLFERPKKGFGVPIEDWLRGPLEDWMMDSLSSDQLNKSNIFNLNSINKILNNFKSEGNLQGQLIWNILVLQNWMIKNSVTG